MNRSPSRAASSSIAPARPALRGRRPSSRSRRSGRWSWVAFAQGRWYATSEVPPPPEGVPHWRALRPGRTIALGQYGAFTVAEVGQRRVVSAEGELPNVAAPGQITRFVDLGGQGGAFATIDYGDDQKIPVSLYVGQQIDPSVMKLDSGAPVEAAQAKVEALACPNCGGNLPIIAPGTAERIVCRYCGMTSDLDHGALVALKAAPRPPVAPAIPLGAEGTLRGLRVIVIGFVVRGCTVDGDRYRWREYLLYAGPSAGYLWLMEEDGAWQFVTPIAPGAVQIEGGGARLRDRQYRFKQSVDASVEHVVGEFYWKVEIGETVRATEYEGPGGIVSVEEAETEVTYSFCERIAARELEQAFNVRIGGAPMFASDGDARRPFVERPLHPGRHRDHHLHPLRPLRRRHVRRRRRRRERELRRPARTELRRKVMPVFGRNGGRFRPPAAPEAPPAEAISGGCDVELAARILR